jgi:hypothetical protein
MLHLKGKLHFQEDSDMHLIFYTALKMKTNPILTQFKINKDFLLVCFLFTTVSGGHG